MSNTKPIECLYCQITVFSLCVCVCLDAGSNERMYFHGPGWSSVLPECRAEVGKHQRPAGHEVPGIDHTHRPLCPSTTEEQPGK